MEEFLRLDGRGRCGAPGAGRRPRLYAGIREQGHWKAIGESGMYKVSEEHEMLRELVKKFVRNELMPLEKNILDRFAAGQPAALSDEENEKLFKQCKELGLWALDVPEEAGGAHLPAVALVGGKEELGYTARALHLSARLAQPAHDAGDGDARAAQEVPRTLCGGRDRLGHRHLRARRRR